MTVTVNKLSILIAEDESLLRMFAVDVFEEAGYHVIDVGNGDDGAQVVADGQPIAALVTDIQMPGKLDGCALAKITHSLHPDAAILVVSARRVPDPEELPPGAKFIGKPYDAKQILRALSEMLPSNKTTPDPSS